MERGVNRSDLTLSTPGCQRNRKSAEILRGQLHAVTSVCYSRQAFLGQRSRTQQRADTTLLFDFFGEHGS
jgi:hypothetical protein